MNIKKISLGLVALVGFGLLITMNGFTSNAKKTPVMVRYQFNSNVLTDLSNPIKWTEVTGTEPQSCGEPGTLPCVIEFDSNLNPDIADFLGDYPTKSDIQAHAEQIETKEELNR